MIDPQSANYIYENVDSDENKLNGMQIQDMSLQLIKKKNKCLKMYMSFRRIRLV